MNPREACTLNGFRDRQESALCSYFSEPVPVAEPVARAQTSSDASAARTSAIGRSPPAAYSSSRGRIMVSKSGTGILPAVLYDGSFASAETIVSSILRPRTGTQGESGGVQSTASTR